MDCSSEALKTQRITIDANVFIVDVYRMAYPEVVIEVDDIQMFMRMNNL